MFYDMTEYLDDHNNHEFSSDTQELETGTDWLKDAIYCGWRIRSWHYICFYQESDHDQSSLVRVVVAGL